MSQKTKGIYRILNAPFLYELTQNFFWRKARRKEFLESYINSTSGLKILDIGCGTGLLYKVLSEFNNSIHYVGLDLNPHYIKYATDKYPNAQFFCSDVANLSKIIEDQFDIIIIMNVLRHLDDAYVGKLFRDCKRFLRKNGRLLTVDPVRMKGAPLIEKLMIRFDRGQHIRYMEEYLNLAKRYFNIVSQKEKIGLLKVPMTVNILEISINE